MIKPRRSSQPGTAQDSAKQINSLPVACNIQG